MKWEYAVCKVWRDVLLTVQLPGKELEMKVEDEGLFLSSSGAKGAKKTTDFPGYANQLGEDGWELVGMVTRAELVNANAVGSTGNYVYMAMFKRPKG
ncbi:MAG TPA: hypothetical protein VG942_17425 [Hyphomonadaceae bacterium]|nr:hypothetical protein [Hyphomonadaceae bacterium]